MSATLWLNKTARELDDDLRRLILAGHTPKASRWVPARRGWSEDTWVAAKRLGIELDNVKRYALLGGLRERVKALHAELGVPHEGFTRASQGGTAKTMIKDLAVYYWTYRKWPEPGRDGRGGWSASTLRMAERLGIRLASVTKFRFHHGSLDDALLLANQLVACGTDENQTVTAEHSTLNTGLGLRNRRRFLNLLRVHPHWHLLESPTPEPEPEEPMTTPTIPPDALYGDQSAPQPPVIMRPETPAMPTALVPRFVPGDVAMRRLVVEGLAVFTPVQVDAVSVTWRRDGVSEAHYTVIDRAGRPAPVSEGDLVTPELVVDAMADLQGRVRAGERSAFAEWLDEGNPLLR